MTRFKILMLTLALSTSSVFAAGIANAQTGKVLVYDQARILRDSQATADINTKVGNIRDQMQRELEPEAKALEAEGKSLEARLANVSREQLANDPVLRGQAEAFQRKDSAHQDKAQIRTQELTVTRNEAMQQLAISLQKILRDVLTERGADIVMEIADVQVFNPELDITDTVLERLNGELPSVTVTRRTMTEEEKTQFLAAVRQREQIQAAQLAQQGIAQQQAFQAIAAQQRAQQQ